MLQEITDRAEQPARVARGGVARPRASYEMPALPYAIEPHISRETLEYHYGKHHRGYIEKLKSLIVGSRLDGLSLDQLVRKALGVLYQVAAQSWNHDFYWRCMTSRFRPDVTSLLVLAIARQFGSLDGFRRQFRQQAAASKFGSGWTWLVRTKEGFWPSRIPMMSTTPCAGAENRCLSVTFGSMRITSITETSARNMSMPSGIS